MIKRNNTQLNRLIFYCGFILLLINKFARIIDIFTNTLLSSNYMYLAGILALVFSVLIKKFSLIDLLLIAYGYFTFISVQDTTLFSCFVLLVASQNIKIDDILRIYVRVQAFILSVCIIVYPILLILGSPYATLGYVAGRNTIRYNFFFLHPNNFAIQCVFTVLVYIYLYKKKLSYYKINIIILLTIVFLLVFPKSQTAVIALIIYLITLFMIKYAKIIWKPFIKFVFPVVIICISIFVYMDYKGMTLPFVNYFSGTFASRFSGAAMSFQIYQVNLFGHFLNEIGNTIYINGQWNTFWLDLAYVRMIIVFGIVGSLIFYYIFFKSLILHIKEKNYMVLSLLVVVIVYAISEWTAFSITTVFPLLFCNVALQSRKSNSILKMVRIRV